VIGFFYGAGWSIRVLSFFVSLLCFINSSYVSFSSIYVQESLGIRDSVSAPL